MRGSGGERCSQDSQNPDSYSGSQGSGLLSPGASRQYRNLPAGRPIATTTFRVFAARRSGAELRSRRWPVIGLIAAAVWNADGRRSPMAMRRAAGSVKAVRRAKLPACRQSRAELFTKPSSNCLIEAGLPEKLQATSTSGHPLPRVCMMGWRVRTIHVRTIPLCCTRVTSRCDLLASLGYPF